MPGRVQAGLWSRQVFPARIQASAIDALIDRAEEIES
jgi:hypothetical protein